MDRELFRLQQEERQMTNQIKQLAKRGNGRGPEMNAIAKNLARNRQMQARCHASKGQVSSVEGQMRQMETQQKVMQAIAPAVQTMTQMNESMNPQQTMKVGMAFAEQSEQMTLNSEMFDDAMAAVEGDGVDDEADLILEEVLTEQALDARARLDGTSVPSGAPSHAVPSSSLAYGHPSVPQQNPYGPTGQR